MNRPGPMTWTRLWVASPLDAASARAAVTALATVPGSPLVVLEATGQAGRVSWRLGCEQRHTSRITSSLRAHLPELRAEPEASTFDGLVDVVAGVRVKGDRALPLKADATEPAVRGLLAALAGARGAERVHVQLVLGARHRPRQRAAADVEARDRRRVALKEQEHRFGCEIRVAAQSDDEARARSLVESVAAALRVLEVPGLRIHLTRSSTRAFATANSPFLWPNHLSVSDLVPMTAWPIGTPPLPGVASPHPKPLTASANLPRSGRVLGDAAASSVPRPVALRTDDALRHLHVLGPTGVGKSTLLANLALADMAAGHGVVVIDPKGDLVNDLLARVPIHRHGDVVVLDARDSSPIGINPLAGSGSPDLAADVTLGVLHSLYADAWGPRTHDILHACLLTLARRGDASLVMIPLLLTNVGLRRSVTGRLVKADPLGLGSFWAWYDSVSEGERQAAIAPLMNKLRPVLLRPGIRAILGQRRPKFDVGKVFTGRKILLVSLAKGQIGPEAAQLLGSLVVSLLWQAALARSSAPSSSRSPVMVTVDELQDYLRLPGDLGDALAQARGLGVGFTLAHQHLGQLPKPLLAAVMANTRSRVAFHLPTSDAKAIATTTRGVLVAEDFETLPAFGAYASLLVKGQPAPWVSLAIRALSPVSVDPIRLRRLSAERYGRALDEVEADFLTLIDARPEAEAGPGSAGLGRTPRPGAGGAS